MASAQMSGACLSPVLSSGKLSFRAAVKHESHNRKHLVRHCGLPLHHLSSLQVLWWEVPGITDWGRGRVLKLKTASYGSVLTSLPFPAAFRVLRLTDEGMRVARATRLSLPLFSLRCAHSFMVYHKVGRASLGADSDIEDQGMTSKESEQQRAFSQVSTAAVRLSLLGW